LFLVYINSLPEVVPESFDVKMFADDVIISKQYTKQDEVAGDFTNGLIAIEQWTRASHLVLSSAKCKYTIFSRLHGHTSPPLALGTTELRPESDLKYLGVHLDQRLTFNKHFEYTRRKCMQRLMTIKRIGSTRKGLHAKLGRRVFLSTIPPILYYGYESWISEYTSSKWIQMSTRLFRLGSIWIMGMHRTTSAIEAIGISGMIPPHIQLIKHILSLPRRLGAEQHLNDQSQEMRHFSPRDTYHLTVRRMTKEMTADERATSSKREIQKYLDLRIQKEWQAADTYRISKFAFDPILDRDWYRGLTRHQISTAGRLITGHIGTRAYLSRFKLSESRECRLCHAEKETRSHLLFRCPVAATLAQNIIPRILEEGIRSMRDLELNTDGITQLVDWWNQLSTLLQ